MTTATAALEIVSTGDIAARFGVPVHAVRNILDRIGLGQKIGRYRVVAAEDLGTVEVALRAAGYLRAGAAGPPSGVPVSCCVSPMKKPSGSGQGTPDGASRNPDREGPRSDAFSNF